MVTVSEFVFGSTDIEFYLFKCCFVSVKAKKIQKDVYSIEQDRFFQSP